MNYEYTKSLEELVKHMVRPLKNVPFNLVIESLSGKKVLPYDIENNRHVEVLALLKEGAVIAGREINRNGISRTRPNEVGNDIEPFVKHALKELGLDADVPSSANGKKKATGYPDIIFWFQKEPYYLECKTYNVNNISTTQRSFYFSPSKDFKIIYDAPHFIVSYEVIATGRIGAKNIYKCRRYKIISIERLSTDVKFEFNSDNRRMYYDSTGCNLLAEGEIE